MFAQRRSKSQLHEEVGKKALNFVSFSSQEFTLFEPFFLSYMASQSVQASSLSVHTPAANVIEQSPISRGEISVWQMKVQMTWH